MFLISTPEMHSQLLHSSSSIDLCSSGGIVYTQIKFAMTFWNLICLDQSLFLSGFVVLHVFPMVLPRFALLATCITKPPKHLTGEETALPDTLARGYFYLYR
jgi:hypothetical protein